MSCVPDSCCCLCIIEPQPNAWFSLPQEPGILSPTEFRKFQIKAATVDADFTISVGRVEGRRVGYFMCHTWRNYSSSVANKTQEENLKHIRQIKYIGFSSWWQQAADWKIISSGRKIICYGIILNPCFMFKPFLRSSVRSFACFCFDHLIF